MSQKEQEENIKEKQSLPAETKFWKKSKSHQSVSSVLKLPSVSILVYTDNVKFPQHKPSLYILLVYSVWDENIY